MIALSMAVSNVEFQDTQDSRATLQDVSETRTVVALRNGFYTTAARTYACSHLPSRSTASCTLSSLRPPPPDVILRECGAGGRQRRKKRKRNTKTYEIAIQMGRQIDRGEIVHEHNTNQEETVKDDPRARRRETTVWPGGVINNSTGGCARGTGSVGGEQGPGIGQSASKQREENTSRIKGWRGVGRQQTRYCDGHRG